VDRGFSVQLTHIKYFLSISENFNRTVVFIEQWSLGISDCRDYWLLIIAYI